MSTILVTGARGNIGARVVARLAKSGARVRVLLRQPSAALADASSLEVVQGSYDDAAAVTAAMAGVSRALFITAGPELARHDGMLDSDMPRPMADALIHLVQALRGAGRLPPNDTVQRLLGKPARTFRAWAIENAAIFQPKAAS